MSSCAAETNLVAMDCMVVCCCCPCLVLQVTVFLFVKLPKKVVVKSKRIILRRWHKRRSAAKRDCSTVSGMKLKELLDGDFGDGINGGECNEDGSGDGWKEKCFAVDDGDDDGGWKQTCFAVDNNYDDDECEALVEQEGLFWFGSFWGRT